MPIGAAGPAHFRFIPTYVGHTVSFSTRLTSISVHPHIRGAYSGSGKSRSLKNGSSPHTWGIHRRYQPFRAGSRFIPTYVGHTSTVAARVASSTGSSPHTWGIPEPHKFQAQRVRFIPTYVGHTHPLQLPGKLPTVHPHIRGAYSRADTFTCFPHGSSPHTWGILVHISQLLGIHRFIPTYVGHTSALPYTPVRISGSSPHTWGIHQKAVSVRLANRFIPTYVGHTSSSTCQIVARTGSSPHT